MDRKIKAGLIGAGFIGPVHLESVRRLGFVDVIAISEVNQDLADSKAHQLGIAKAYGDYHDLLANDDIEVVHVCTPNFTHYEIVKAALEARKHVISEKPLAMNSEESAKLVALASEIGVVNAVDFAYRSYPLVHQVKAMIDRGDLGNVHLVHGGYLQDWLLFETDYNWRVEPRLGGKSRAVADIGSHWFDLVQFVTGSRVTEVMADLKTVIPVRKKSKQTAETFSSKVLGPRDYEEEKIETEDYGAVFLTFENGAKGAFIASQISAGRKNKLFFEIDGSNFAVAWDQENPNDLWKGKRDAPNELLMKDPLLALPEVQNFMDFPGGHPEGYPDAVKMFMRSVYAYIAGRNESPTRTIDFPTFVDGHNEMLIVDAVIRSNETRKWACVEYEKTNLRCNSQRRH